RGSIPHGATFWPEACLLRALTGHAGEAPQAVTSLPAVVLALRHEPLHRLLVPEALQHRPRQQRLLELARTIVDPLAHPHPAALRAGRRAAPSRKPSPATSRGRHRPDPPAGPSTRCSTLRPGARCCASGCPCEACRLLRLP